jgi:translation initiation factor 3 subunit J
VQKNATKPSAKAPAKKGKQQASTSAEEPDEPLSPTSEKIRQQRYLVFFMACLFLVLRIRTWPCDAAVSVLCELDCRSAHGCNVYLLYRLVEEADFKSTTDLFAKKSGEQKSLDTFIPKSESDFAEYAELIANKLLPYDVR